MFNAADFRMTCVALIAKLPPGVQADTELGRLLFDYIEQTDVICSSDHSQRARVNMLERAQRALVDQLEAMCDTEQPDAAEQPATAAPEPTRPSSRPRKPKGRRDSEKNSVD